MLMINNQRGASWLQSPHIQQAGKWNCFIKLTASVALLTFLGIFLDKIFTS